MNEEKLLAIIENELEMNNEDKDTAVHVQHIPYERNIDINGFDFQE